VGGWHPCGLVFGFFFRWGFLRSERALFFFGLHVI